MLEVKILELPDKFNSRANSLKIKSGKKMGNAPQKEAIDILRHRISRLDMDHVDIKLKKMPCLKQHHFTQTVKNREFVFTDSALEIFNYKDGSWSLDRKLYKIWEPMGHPFAISQDKSEIYLVDERGFIVINRKASSIKVLESD